MPRRKTPAAPSTALPYQRSIRKPYDERRMLLTISRMLYRLELAGMAGEITVEETLRALQSCSVVLPAFAKLSEAAQLQARLEKLEKQLAEHSV